MSSALQVSLGITKHFGKDAKTRLDSVLATRNVFERAMRERLAAACPNVTMRCGCGVAGLTHGAGDAMGLVTGARLAGLASCFASRRRWAVLHSPQKTATALCTHVAASSLGHIAAYGIGPEEDWSRQPAR